MKYPEHRECVGEAWEPATISKESLVDQGAAGTSPYHTVSISVDYVDYVLASGFLFPRAPGSLNSFFFLNESVGRPLGELIHLPKARCFSGLWPQGNVSRRHWAQLFRANSGPELCTSKKGDSRSVFHTRYFSLESVENMITGRAWGMVSRRYLKVQG